MSHRIHGICCIRGQVRVYVEMNNFYADLPIAGTGDAKSHWTLGRLGVGHIGSEPFPDNSFWNRLLGFYSYETGYSTSWSDENQSGIAFPIWLPLALTLVAPAFWTIRWRRRRWRRRMNLCPDCGYDVRCSPDRCPECGRPTSA